MMVNLQRAFINFFRQFSVPAYLEGYAIEYNSQGLPTPPPMPYITFDFPRNDFFTNGIVSARIWARSSSFTPVLGILELIEKAVPTSGAMLKLDDDEGAIILHRGTPFFQYQPPEPDDQMLKIGYVLFEARSYVI